MLLVVVGVVLGLGVVVVGVLVMVLGVGFLVVLSVVVIGVGGVVVMYFLGDVFIFDMGDYVFDFVID